MSRVYYVTRDDTGRWLMLHEGTAKECREDSRNPLRVSGRTAHRIVRKDAIPHSTPLWIDFDNRVRRAQEGC